MKTIALSSLDAEVSVLGTMLVDKIAPNRVKELLPLDAFTVDSHRQVYSAILELSSSDQVVDIITVSNKLPESLLDAIGGKAYLSELAKESVAIAHLETHTQLILEAYQKRTLIGLAEQIQQDIYAGLPINQALETTQKGYRQVLGLSPQGRKVRHIGDIAEDIYLKALKNKDIDLGDIGTTTGFDQLDQICFGVIPGRLNIVAARPGMGKTAYMLAIALNVAMQGIGVYIASLEMSDEKLVTRVLSQMLSASTKSIANGRLEGQQWADFEQLLPQLKALDIHISDDPHVNSVAKFHTDIERLNLENPNAPIGLAMVDYIQMMGKDAEDTSALTAYANALKAMAKTLDLEVYGLAQLNRGVEARADKRPKMSDIKSSGGFEQAADLITLLYRDSYYEEKNQADPSGLDPVIIEIIIDKHRDGPTGAVELEYVMAHNLFREKPKGFSPGGYGVNQAIKSPPVQQPAGSLKTGPKPDQTHTEKSGAELSTGFDDNSNEYYGF